MLPKVFEVIFKPLALVDLEDIWFYTYTKWSLDQANDYQNSIDNCILKISKDPLVGISVENFSRKYYRFIINHHSIYYYTEINKVVIVRILHEMMDTQKHL